MRYFTVGDPGGAAADRLRPVSRAHHVGFEGQGPLADVRILTVMLLLTLVGVSAQFQPTSQDWAPFEARDDLVTPGDLDGALRVLRFVQVSDAHILDDDAPAPMRVDAFDELFFGTGVSDGAERPQDEYTDEALDAVIRAINALHAEDPLDFIVTTGDNIDNSLENELMRFLDNWEGRLTKVGPFSGAVCLPDGQSTSVDDDDHDVSDACTHLPDHVAANNTPLVEGLPWFSAFGNHDGLIQGNVPIEPSFQEAAAQFGRRFLQQSEFVAMHFDGGASCAASQPAGQLADDFGHGYGFAGERLCDEDPDNDGYYSFGSRGVRFIVLDTVNDSFVTGNENYAGGFNPQTTLGGDILGGYSEGSLDPVQYEWLVSELDRHKDSLVVLLSHHTVTSMFSKHVEGNCGGPNGECLEDLLTAAGYMTGPKLVETLTEYPNVIAWIGGHVHRNHIQPMVRAGAPSPGFWNIETSSIIDMPQESRIIEVWVTADGAKGFFAITPFTHDFHKSRELAMTDDQFDAELAHGEAGDRQVILWFDLPAGVTLVPQSSLPHAMRVEEIAPARMNGSHGSVGQSLDVVLRVTDQVRGVPLSGLRVAATVEHADPQAKNQVLRILEANMTDRGDGTYGLSFTPAEGRVHYVAYRVTDPVGGYPAVNGIMSLDIAGLDEPAAKGKKSPASSIGVLVLTMALLGAARRCSE